LFIYSERKCADTTGTVPVPWAGHKYKKYTKLQIYKIYTKYKYIFQIKYTKAILSNGTLDGTLCLPSPRPRPHSPSQSQAA